MREPEAREPCRSGIPETDGRVVVGPGACGREALAGRPGRVTGADLGDAGRWTGAGAGSGAGSGAETVTRVGEPPGPYGVVAAAGGTSVIVTGSPALGAVAARVCRRAAHRQRRSAAWKANKTRIEFPRDFALPAEID
ncbi:hypothetical protein [Streptomyces sp. NPDC006527]|uniref:hypothetical protein n=1 Tax=Streptomyces sp. NPDC006527 TaxID=3364749 RepID=UPI0036983AF1